MSGILALIGLILAFWALYYVCVSIRRVLAWAFAAEPWTMEPKGFWDDGGYEPRTYGRSDWSGWGGSTTPPYRSRSQSSFWDGWNRGGGFKSFSKPRNALEQQAQYRRDLNFRPLKAERDVADGKES